MNLENEILEGQITLLDTIIKSTENDIVKLENSKKCPECIDEEIQSLTLGLLQLKIKREEIQAVIDANKSPVEENNEQGT